MNTTRPSRDLYRFSLPGLAAGSVLAMACSGAPAIPEAPVNDTFAAQAERGGALYGEYCASCHGADGRGTDGAPPVVGLADGALPLAPPDGAELRKRSFETVGDVATFVVAEMPPGDGGALPEADYWAILAFDLKANGIELEQPLDAQTASTLVIPR